MMFDIKKSTLFLKTKKSIIFATLKSNTTMFQKFQTKIQKNNK